jgi:hypothetical protein
MSFLIGLSGVQTLLSVSVVIMFFSTSVSTDVMRFSKVLTSVFLEKVAEE